MPDPLSQSAAPTETPISAGVTPTAPARPANSECPAPANPPLPATPAIEQMASAVLSYLNAGATTEQLNAALNTWGAIAMQPGTNAPIGGATSAKLLQKDDAQVIAVFSAPQANQPATRLGDVIVAACDKGQYRAVYLASQDPAFSGLAPNPRVHNLIDITGDSLVDLSFITGECGSGTCLDSLSILAHLPAQDVFGLTNISPDMAGVPNPTIHYAPSGAGQMVVISHGTFDDVNAGPQRRSQENWAFNGSVMAMNSASVEPALYRIHALQDADNAFKRKDFAAATALYTRVMNDTTLLAWDGPGALKDEPSVLGAFAQFRLAQLALAQNNVAGAQSALSTLAAMPANVENQPYFALGKAVSDALTDTNDPEIACNTAIAFAEKTPQVYEQIGAGTFGFANTDYQPADMCI